MSELDDCIKNGLLRRMPPSKEDAERSLAAAGSWLAEAKGALNAGAHGSCILASYEAMFHSARSLLIRDGYRERSHYCIVRYLDEAYAKKGLLSREMVELIDSYRELRHDTAYGLEIGAEETDAKRAVKDAEAFLRAISKIFSR